MAEQGFSELLFQNSEFFPTESNSIFGDSVPDEQLIHPSFHPVSELFYLLLQDRNNILKLTEIPDFGKHLNNIAGRNPSSAAIIMYRYLLNSYLTMSLSRTREGRQALKRDDLNLSGIMNFFKSGTPVFFIYFFSYL